MGEDIARKIINLYSITVRQRMDIEKKYRFGVRGSLVLVLLVSSFALFVVLALSTLSSININIVRSQVEYNRSLLTARAVVAQLIYELDTFDYQQSEDVDVSSPSRAMNLKERYNLYPLFPDRTNRTQEESRITFDQNQLYYSTDNLEGENSTLGWRDKGKNVKSVPPFSIDFIVNVRVGGSERHFEVLIKRTWPYAAFCEKGPIAITSPKYKGFDISFAPSVIKGSVFSFSSVLLGIPDSNDINNSINGDMCTVLSKPVEDNHENIDPLYILPKNTLKGKKRYNVVTRRENLIESIRLPDKKDFKELNIEEIPEFEIVGSSTDSKLSLIDGSFTWTGSPEKEIDFRKMVDKSYYTALSNPNELPDGMQHYIEDFLSNRVDSQNFLHSDLIYMAVVSYIKQTYYGNSLYLKKNLILRGTAGCNKYLVKGNISNHYIVYQRSGNEKVNALSESMVPKIDTLKKGLDIFSGAGLILKDCTLFVDGDVELYESDFSVSSDTTADSSLVEKPFSIEGNNATLIISGNLKIVGGQLDSKDKGMVMLAQNIEFSTKGVFKGIILSKGLIIINPYPGVKSKDSMLNIEGGLACCGIGANNCGYSDAALNAYSNGMVLRGIDITFDSRYTKVLHQLGKSEIILWQEIE